MTTAKKTELHITVSPTGEVQITVQGVAGASCTDATRDLEAALGNVRARELTAEYYQPAEGAAGVAGGWGGGGEEGR